MAASLTLVVLTYNEEANVERCLASVHDVVGEIVVVDSFSADRTLEICRRYTDRVYQHRFHNHGQQLNWALDHVPLARDLVLTLDADERLTPELGAEIRAALPTLPGDVTGLIMKRRVYFMGRWIRHGDFYPFWFLRIFRTGCARYEEISEDHAVLSHGRTARLRHDFIDDNRKGLSFWTDKHAHWAIGEMLDTMSMSQGHGLPAHTLRVSPIGSQVERRRWLRSRVYARLPLFWRAFGYFLYRYVLKLGFLDGPEGLIFHFLQGCWYRFYVDAKIYEARRMGLRHAERLVEYSASKPWEAVSADARPS